MSTFVKRSAGAMSGALAWLAYAPYALAFNQTGDIFGPVPNIGGVTDPREGVLTLLRGILNFLALVAVIVIVIAGIRMVVSSGDEGAVDKAKKTILYAIVGLIVILLASAIVGFVIDISNGA